MTDKIQAAKPLLGIQPKQPQRQLPSKKQEPTCKSCAFWSQYTDKTNLKDAIKAATSDSTLKVDKGVCRALPPRAEMILAPSSPTLDGSGRQHIRPSALTLWPETFENEFCGMHPQVQTSMAMMLKTFTSNELIYDPDKYGTVNGGFNRQPSEAEARRYAPDAKPGDLPPGVAEYLKSLQT
jgi:hypothetical protein